MSITISIRTTLIFIIRSCLKLYFTKHRHLNNSDSETIFHRRQWIEKFTFDKHVDADRGQAVDLDDRGTADGGEDIGVDSHGDFYFCF